MENLLKQYFPMIRTKKDILKEIRTTPTLLQTFNKWKPEQQEHFLDFCTGAKGVKVLYDGFFKEVMDPDITPHRLEKFLSLLLEQEITIVSVLANDSTRIADESSILITDIVVRLSDGSLANVEVQKSVIFSRANGAPAILQTCSFVSIKKPEKTVMTNKSTTNL